MRPLQKAPEARPVNKTVSSERREVLGKIGALSVWRQGDTRAPHKPLLLLVAISRLLRSETREVRFVEIEEKLQQLVRTFGPPRSKVHPEYPFWWLQSDGLWVLSDRELYTSPDAKRNPTHTALRRYGIGGFPESIDAALRHDRRLVRQIVSLLLHAHFPESMQLTVLDAVGIQSDLCSMPDRRDDKFRGEVLAAYGHTCAVCGFDVRIGQGVDLALEAAHVKWRQAGGPDVVQSGLALCSIHHKALDFGAIALEEACRVLVSGSAYGTAGCSQWFLQFHRKRLRFPHSASLCLQSAFTAWHRREVFRAPARD